MYLNNTLEFGSTDVGPIVLGIKNSGADGVYLPLDSNTNFAIVQALQQNGVKTKANVLATGYSQDLLDQPIAKTITPNDVMQSSYKPIELGGPAIKTFVNNLKKGGITGVPNYGVYTGYITCDMAITALKNAGKNPTRQSFVDGIRNANDGMYDSAGLTCKPIDLSYDHFGKISSTPGCLYYVQVKDGKFVVYNRRQADHQQDGGRPRHHRQVHRGQLVVGGDDHHGGTRQLSRARTSDTTRGSRFAGSPSRVSASFGIAQLPGGPFGTSRNGMFLSCVISRGILSTFSEMLLRAISVVPPPMPERLTLEEVEAVLGPGVVGQRGRRVGARQLERDGALALERDRRDQPGDGGAVVGHHAGAHARGDPSREGAARQAEHVRPHRRAPACARRRPARWRGPGRRTGRGSPPGPSAASR